MKNEVREKIKKYKELKADIIEIDFRLEELEEEILGISSLPQGEKISKTYKITSSVENQVERYLDIKEKLISKRLLKVRNVQRIENALSVLNDDEKDIVRMIIIEKKKYQLVQNKYGKTYSRIKQIELEALNRMKIYIL